ncbi:MAG TPA: bifunctional salicylyl-CoA 5-hydroxylase/oxidoreductase [Aromatoleum sp.]|uniref:bifunctional salicylyl-CoA 5-hydroxylase/oxidoreductase n=1 Tax=Aromatoleum sp. TaxID=2307007 RepID=UPI002B4A3BFF|nr:bifunctional salicylyl-CoA 5-hydroxylase/oxidoreductase [Aromatoleum sp.]HJV27893.1 bifunctional salicylyl-CoA 5-hydroxylase/oxidoreductase [Aromatoleum sp.]
MRIVCLGGGPAGLYFSILMKKANPEHDITVIDRNAADNTFGWGVVFSDQTMDGFRDADAKVVEEIEANFHHWDDIDVFFKDRKITSGGHGFCGIARLKLLEIFQRRAAELGVNMIWEQEIKDPDEYARDYDLVIGSDGVFSATRRKHEEHFNPRIDQRKCRFIWLGTKKKLDAFTFAFKETEWGWFNLHAYRFNEEWSTFIVETPEETWLKAGMDKFEQDESIAFCEKLFADLLDGHKLISNARHLRGSAMWQKFNRVLCERWYKDNIVLLGDAAHTAHFSIGSGTKLAMEDAISLVKVLNSSDGTVPERLARYQAEREIEALKLQSAARNRMTWFENIESYVHMAPEQFAFSLLTGSQRVGHANQKLRDAAYVEGVDRWVAQQAGVPQDPSRPPVPPMFTPFKLRGMTLSNRVVVSPMCTYSATDGMPNDFHFQHYTTRGLGGAALVMTEMTCISPEARITPGCAGIWNDVQVSAWKRIVDFVHANSNAKMGLQIGHAGRKGSTKLSWEGIDQPLESGNWPLIAPSPLPLIAGVSQVPREMTRVDMDQVKADFVAATLRAQAAGFDLVEFHAAHGYLMSSFISPLTNQRQDEYGGSLENRCRYPLEVFQAMRAVWPADKPMSVRISAHDWVPGGTTPEDAVEIARLFKDAGADIVHVSSGQVSKNEQPVYGRMFQVPFSDKIRNEVHVPTITVGNIFEADHVNTIIAAGRADLCALARPHLSDPAWTLHAAAEQGYFDVTWPKQYVGGKVQLERNLGRAAQIALNA